MPPYAVRPWGEHCANNMLCSSFSIVDYTAILLTVTVAAGETSSCFTGAIIDDLIALEGTESFDLEITSTSPGGNGVIIGLTPTRISITDNDSKWLLC